MVLELQAVLFKRQISGRPSKFRYTSTQARAWLKKNRIRPSKKTHITKNYLRYRVRTPKKYKKFITRSLKGKDKGILWVEGIL